MQVLENMNPLVSQKGGPKESLRILNENSKKFLELEPSDLKSIDETLKSIDNDA